MKGKIKKGRQKEMGMTISKNVQEWTFPVEQGQLKTGQDGRGLLRMQLWCPDDLPRFCDKIEKRIVCHPQMANW